MGHRILPFLILTAAVPALAQEDFRDGRIRYVEAGVTIQRATEGAAEDAMANLPFLPGDRVWTDDVGRVEFQFADGTLLRLDSRSKLDYTARDEARDRSVLRLWAGGAYLHTGNGHAGGGWEDVQFEIETPGGLVEATERGVLRVDVENGETRVSVFAGEALFESGQSRVRLEAGERSAALRGEAPEEPRGFDRADADDFSRWDEDRDRRMVRAARNRRYLPDEVVPYADELESQGSWYYEAAVGYVWRPYVSLGWRPYSDGHWAWTAFGWTWVPYETWGWAPFHYGRWGHSVALGWYWIPGSTWGPAWVTWAVGGDYVGWCPLGYRDQPVYIHENSGHAVPRGAVATGAGTSPAWVYVRRGDLTAHSLPRLRVTATPPEALRVVESPRARLSRDLRILDGEPAARHARTRPTPGDTVPELRSDPRLGPGQGDRTATTSAPLARRRAPSDDDRERYTESHSSRSRDRAIGRGDQGWRSGAAAPASPPPVPASPSSAWSRERDRSEPHPRQIDADREVLRPFFRPLSESRGGTARPATERPESQRPVSERPAHQRPTSEHGASEHSIPRSEPHAAPASEPQRTAHPPASSGDRAAPRKKAN